MRNWGDLREVRGGVMLHYDGSGSDAGAVSWLRDDPRCKVSYNWLVLDTGAVVTIAPRDARAWHAGVCRPSDPDLFPYRDANSYFYGIAVAAQAGEVATSAQEQAVVALCTALCHARGWEAERITGHEAECWPRGRKVDPGLVLPVAAVQRAVGERLALMAPRGSGT